VLRVSWELTRQQDYLLVTSVLRNRLLNTDFFPKMRLLLACFEFFASATDDEISSHRLHRSGARALDSVRDSVQALLDIMVWNANEFGVHKPEGALTIAVPLDEVYLSHDIDECSAQVDETIAAVFKTWQENVKKATEADMKRFSQLPSTESLGWWVKSSVSKSSNLLHLWSTDKAAIEPVMDEATEFISALDTIAINDPGIIPLLIRMIEYACENWRAASRAILLRINL
jgi:hypothetical protein